MINQLIRFGLAAALIFSSATTLAVGLTTGQVAPALQVQAKALVIKGNDLIYQSWLGDDLTGKVRVVLHINAAFGADKINQPFMDAVLELNLDTSVFSTLTVINVSDVSSMLQMMIQSQFEGVRRRHSNDQELVWDTEGSMRSAWGLAEKGVSITLVDVAGKVVAHKNGKLESEDMKEFIGLIHQHLPK